MYRNATTVLENEFPFDNLFKMPPWFFIFYRAYVEIRAHELGWVGGGGYSKTAILNKDNIKV